MNGKKPLGYLGGDIMSFGSNLAREYEYKKFTQMNLPVDIYSPIKNKSINDKTGVTEEENNVLAEKITAADIQRLWDSDFVVIEPAQFAIGSMCELGALYGWKYLTDKLIYIIDHPESGDTAETLLYKLEDEILRINKKDVYCHYFDLRTNHLNEKDWRRSFGMNQLLYGMILACSKDNKLYESFDEVLLELEKKYKNTTKT